METRGRRQLGCIIQLHLVGKLHRVPAVADCASNLAPARWTWRAPPGWTRDVAQPRWATHGLVDTCAARLASRGEGYVNDNAPHGGDAGSKLPGVQPAQRLDEEALGDVPQRPKHHVLGPVLRGGWAWYLRGTNPTGYALRRSRRPRELPARQGDERR